MFMFYYFSLVYYFFATCVRVLPRACVFFVFNYFLYFSLVFISLFLFLYRRGASGSGARGLSKAPVGDRGLAPGVFDRLRSVSLGDVLFPPALAGGSFRGGQPVVVLGIYRLTDTGGGSLGGFYGVL